MNMTVEQIYELLTKKEMKYTEYNKYRLLYLLGLVQLGSYPTKRKRYLKLTELGQRFLKNIKDFQHYFEQNPLRYINE